MQVIVGHWGWPGARGGPGGREGETALTLTEQVQPRITMEAEARKYGHLSFVSAASPGC